MSAVRPSPQARPELTALGAYRLAGGESAPVKLNQNECPQDWPEDLKAEVARRLLRRPWNRYPPLDGRALREALAGACGVDAEMVAVASGSNEALLALVQAFACGRRVALVRPGYSLSVSLAVAGGAEVRPVLLREDFSLDLPAMVEAVSDPDVALVYLASPNNPTGAGCPRDDVLTVVEAARGVVVLDEAYAEFDGQTLLPAVREYPHLAVLRTFSKAFALAGARVGYVVAHPDVIASVRAALPPYNLNLFAQEAALAVLARPELVAARVDQVIRERERVYQALQRVDGVRPYPSRANFILFRTPLDAGVLLGRLLARGILVRDVSGQPLLDRCLRVTIGAPEENDRFLDALAQSVAP
ncbi:MAG: histidinol-phosphate transaminase [Armatimonadota bacterium]|nr:histidinol-phosphate transaminase [Armatimonadota bacterium]MDR7401248.1 histidinol-phosphate transaminase [Armatimonadota bacterium]MDR7402993.1 histidinol-phosphate transaminase [Armatimonadota bacterium]MDR7437142.1 histidinol-phosphate transaminase [Armatimonadota bacterium]MDR7471894.1 histidinol-phosphate transaminase [Armatimonadota bacterium]